MSHIDDSNETLKNPWNQLFMQYNLTEDTQKREAVDYKISSSLKTIWNDVTDDRQITSNASSRQNISPIICPVKKPSYATCLQQQQQQHQQPLPEQFVQFGNNVIYIGDHQSNLGKIVVPVSSSDNAVSNNAFNSNSLKGRAITARNGGYIANFDNEKQKYCSSSSTGPSTITTQQQQNQPFELLLQQVHVIVSNGFLDKQILNEPISPDTFDLIQMLIYYVMEYKQTKLYANNDNNPALCTEMKKIFYKINLIQNEIALSQFRHVQQKRAQQEIMRSYSTIDGMYYEQQNNVQFGPATSNDGSSGRYSPLMRSGNDFIRMNELNARREAENHDRETRRFFQHRPDQNAPPSHHHLNSYANLPIKFVQSAKNVDKHQFYKTSESQYFTNSHHLHSKSERN